MTAIMAAILCREWISGRGYKRIAGLWKGGGSAEVGFGLTLGMVGPEDYSEGDGKVRVSENVEYNAPLVHE